MKNFAEWIKNFEDVFPQEPININNPENKQTMIRVEKWNKYTKKLDGGDIVFFNTWEEAKKWMEEDYFINSGGLFSSKQERINNNKEDGVFYRVKKEIGSAEAHNEFGY